MIGIFGGSFDPPHLGHLGVIKSFWKFFPESKSLILIPNYISPFKKEKGVKETDVITMLQILIEENSIPNTVVEEVEIQKKATSYTIETLEYIRLKYPTEEIFFLIGVDNIAKFSIWKEYKRILEITKLLVFDREMEDKSNLPEELIEYSNRILFMENSKVKASSSEIRGLPHSDWKLFLTPKVIEYINKEGLYGFKSPN
ncbi:MAG: nicotinate (nicotinamide) nucleotide adenylyltransferase [Leptospiraceae bacterium]|nr:nicotinate (nicotinamide) nucleotide adenylyltransferase [Leptospiraceae bacterium]